MFGPGTWNKRAEASQVYVNNHYKYDKEEN